MNANVMGIDLADIADLTTTVGTTGALGTNGIGGDPVFEFTIAIVVLTDAG